MRSYELIYVGEPIHLLAKKVEVGMALIYYYIAMCVGSMHTSLIVVYTKSGIPG